jgi:hypothetical protein
MIALGGCVGALFGRLIDKKQVKQDDVLRCCFNFNHNSFDVYT